MIRHAASDRSMEIKAAFAEPFQSFWTGCSSSPFRSCYRNWCARREIEFVPPIDARLLHKPPGAGWWTQDRSYFHYYHHRSGC
jgi:hypothetical protein